MNRHRVLKTGMAISVLFAALSVAVLGQATLTLMFREMDPHVGQPFELRLTEANSMREIARLSVPEIAAAQFKLQWADLPLGASYRIDFYADANGNGRYDAPPADHAWRLELPEMQGDATVEFSHNIDFTDIRWPPAADGEIAAGEYDDTLADPGTGMRVHWQHDGAVLYVGLESPGTGWLSIGFGPERRMQGANIIIAAISDGVLIIEDHYGSAPTAHRRDTVDHILQAAGHESEGRSVLEFAIPLASGDAQDKDLAPGSEVTIILGYHRSDDGLSTRHSARSTNVITLAD